MGCGRKLSRAEGANERVRGAAGDCPVPQAGRTDKATRERAVDQARRANLSRAMALLKSPGLAGESTETVHEALRVLNQQDESEVPGLPLLAQASDLLDFIDGQWVCKLVAGLQGAWLWTCSQD